MTIHYFRAEPNTPAAELADSYRAKFRKRASISAEVAKDLKLPKGVKFYGTDSSIWGVTTDWPRDEIPAGWIWSKKRRCYVPDKKTDEGKYIAKALATIPGGIDWMHESCEAFGHSLVMGSKGGGLCLRFAAWAWSKRGSVCQMHSAVKKAAKKWPEGLVEITATEANEIIPGGNDG
jgi:hypothetical protein